MKVTEKNPLYFKTYLLTLCSKKISKRIEQPCETQQVST